MKKFKEGKTYYATSLCDHNCVYKIEIVKRTAKIVTIIEDGKQRRTKLFSDENGEYVIPDRSSMAPIFRAERECETSISH